MEHDTLPTVDAPTKEQVNAIWDDELKLTEAQLGELEADSPELLAMLKEIEEEAKASFTGEGSDNPLMGQPIGKLVQSYLSCTPHGIRWLAQKAKINRNRLQRYIDGDENAIAPEQISAIIDVIMADREREVAQAQAKLNATGPSKFAGNRAARRAQKANARSKKIKPAYL